MFFITLFGKEGLPALPTGRQGWGRFIKKQLLKNPP
jgi:hypothetical protein